MFLASTVSNDHADTLKKIGRAAKDGVAPGDQLNEIVKLVEIGFDTESPHLAKPHRCRLRRRERFWLVQKLGADASYLRFEMRQICYNVSGL